MNTYSAIRPSNGAIRRLWFEAADDAEARATAAACGAGLEGPSATPGNATAAPVSFNLAETQRLLGGVSRTTIYRDVARGRLTRVPGLRRVLVTYESIQRRVSGSGRG